MKLLLSFALLLFISACGNEMEHILSGEEKGTDGGDLTEIITIGPYIERCQGFFIGSDIPVDFDCYLEFNAEADRWQFLCEPIEGFDFEPGYIYTLEIRLEDRGEEIQDVGRYTYHFVKVIDTTKVPDDFNSGLSCG